MRTKDHTMPEYDNSQFLTTANTRIFCRLDKWMWLFIIASIFFNDLSTWFNNSKRWVRKLIHNCKGWPRCVCFCTSHSSVLHTPIWSCCLNKVSSFSCNFSRNPLLWVIFLTPQWFFMFLAWIWSSALNRYIVGNKKYRQKRRGQTAAKEEIKIFEYTFFSLDLSLIWDVKKVR